MNAMTEIQAGDMRWFAVRMKPNENGGARVATVGHEREKYLNRAGRVAHRNVKGTGKRVFLSEHLLTRAGFDVFLPVKKNWRKKNRFSDEQHLVASPLLADWLFICLPVDATGHSPAWLRVMELGVVAGVVATGGRPLAMTDQTMLGVMKRYGKRGAAAKVQRRVDRRDDFGGVRPVAGDAAVVLDGAFRDLSGSVLSLNGNEAQVMLNLFGRETLCNVSLLSLGRVQ